MSMSKREELQQTVLHTALNINANSQFAKFMKDALNNPKTRKFSFEIRRHGIAVKVNENMWTPTLSCGWEPDE